MQITRLHLARRKIAQIFGTTIFSLYFFFLLINKMKMISNENHMILIAA